MNEPSLSAPTAPSCIGSPDTTNCGTVPLRIIETTLLARSIVLAVNMLTSSTMIASQVWHGFG